LIEFIEFWWYPIVVLLTLVFLFFWSKKIATDPELRAARDKAAWEEAHRYKPCPHDKNAAH
jgi:hypothetical protein